MTITAQILGTAMAMGGAMAAAGLFVLRAVIAKDVKPLGDAMLVLTTEMRSLTSSIADERAIRKEERDESRAIHRDLERIVQDHETRLTVLEAPKAKITPRRRS